MANAEAKPQGSVLAHEPSQRTVVAVFVALMIAMVIGSLDQTIVSTALPTIVGELGGMSHLLWVTTAYVLASTITMPVYGKVGDMIGRKGLFILSQVLFLVGSIMCGAEPIWACLLQGALWLVWAEAVPWCFRRPLLPTSFLLVNAHCT